MANADDMDLLDETTESETQPLLASEEVVIKRSPWCSMSALLVLLFLLMVPEGMLQTLAVQFARSKFAANRDVDLPVGVNACEAIASNQSQALAEIQSAVALFVSYQGFLQLFIPVLTALPLVALADYTGRRPLLLFTCFAGLVENSSYLIVSYFDISVYYTLIASTVCGVCGGFTLLNAVSAMYVTDIFPRERRGVALAVLYAMENIVIYLGPLVINLVLEALSSFTICFLIPTCSTLLACLWMLPPSLVRESVRRKPLPGLGKARGGCRGIRRLLSSGLGAQIIVLLVCDFVVNLLVEGFDNTMYLYGLGEPFCWSPTLLGVFAVVHGVPHAIAAPLLVWVLESFVSDQYWLIYVSLLSSIAQFVLTAVATSNAVLIYGASLAGIFGGMSQPVYVSLLTDILDKKFHSTLFSMYSLVYGSSIAFSLIIQSAAYSFLVSVGHTTVLFYVMAALCGLIFVPTIYMHIVQPKKFEDDDST